MADIKTYLAKIKEAIYGEEVRGSIHDALVVINRESEAAKTSAAESADNAAKVLNNTKDVAEAAQTAAAAANEAAEAAMDYVLGDISEKTVTFETAAQRAGIESGDSLSVAFGKLAKFCADLDQHAFNPLANNLTTNTAGYGMDARQGPVIDKKISDVQTSVDELNTKLNNTFPAGDKIQSTDGTVIVYTAKANNWLFLQGTTNAYTYLLYFSETGLNARKMDKSGSIVSEKTIVTF